MRVSVDSDSCIGAGLCVWAVPDVFDQSQDEGTVIIRDANPPERLHRAVREAQRVCPSRAIDLDEDG